MQGVLEEALARVANHDARVTACGRTDAGVHALCLVAHFESDARREERSWGLGLNSHLPDGVSVLWIRPVDEEFHARFSAFARSYRYRMLNRWIRPALEHGRSSWIRQPLNAELMNQAAQYLAGEHDFSSFRAAACQANHAVREIQAISVRREEDVVVLDVTANGFLYHMVRNIVGSLIEVGRGDRPVKWLTEILEGQDRKVAGVTAESQGLYFMNVRYDPKYGIPGMPEPFPYTGNQE